jgi:hypothetical protein
MRASQQVTNSRSCHESPAARMVMRGEHVVIVWKRWKLCRIRVNHDVT